MSKGSLRLPIAWRLSFILLSYLLSLLLSIPKTVFKPCFANSLGMSFGLPSFTVSLYILCHEYALWWLNFLRFFDTHRICLPSTFSWFPLLNYYSSLYLLAFNRLPGVSILLVFLKRLTWICQATFGYIYLLYKVLLKVLCLLGAFA